MRTVAFAALCSFAASALAHPGHGAEEIHLHVELAAAGVAAFAAIVALALRRRRKARK